MELVRMRGAFINSKPPGNDLTDNLFINIGRRAKMSIYIALNGSLKSLSVENLSDLLNSLYYPRPYDRLIELEKEWMEQQEPEINNLFNVAYQKQYGEHPYGKENNEDNEDMPSFPYVS